MSMQVSDASLVRRTKCSTVDEYKWQDWEIEAINEWATEAARAERPYTIDLPNSDSEPPVYIEPFADLLLDTEEAGKYVVLTCDAWAGIEKTEEGLPYTPLEPEHGIYKAQIHVDTRSKAPPPVHSGDRWTDHLSAKGKKKIEESAKYLHRLGIGYRTFLTLTFITEWRNAIQKWDLMSNDNKERSSIGKQVSTFLNVLQQRHRNGLTFNGHFRRKGKLINGVYYKARGEHFIGRVEAWDAKSKWTPIIWQDGFRIPAQHRPFQFAWVIENPTNDNGASNPHIHILMNWGVKLEEFFAWSRWIENTWGKGFAKLERIKKPKAAAYYLGKAANYISKGTDGEQGLVRGNRYNISRDARPPKTKLLGIFALGRFKEVVNLGQNSGSATRPNNLWFHPYGLGASSKRKWDSLWSAAIQDGITLSKPPKGLYATRLNNACVRLLRRKYDYWSQYTEALFRDMDCIKQIQVGF